MLRCNSETERLITQDRIDLLLSWRNSGFGAQNRLVHFCGVYANRLRAAYRSADNPDAREGIPKRALRNVGPSSSTISFEPAGTSG
jgi:hypothetical protein